MEAQKTKIPGDLLERFRNLEYQEPEQGKTKESQKEQDKRLDILSKLNDTIAWGIRSGDDFCKKKNLPGIGSLEPDQLAELTGIVLERNVSTEFLEKSPEVMLGGILVSIFAQNYIYDFIKCWR